jgi:hypothetical protein
LATNHKKYSYQTSPWYYAKESNRPDYITPEDISFALEAGGVPWLIAIEVLEAISWGEAEDAKLCAYVTYKAMT